MDDCRKKTFGSALLGIVLIACVTGLLRATAGLWWPVVSVYTGVRLLRRFVFSLAIVLLAPAVWLLRSRLGWSRVHIAIVVVSGLLVGYLLAGLLAGENDVPMSPREHGMMVQLLGVVSSGGKLPGDGALLGTTIAVPDCRAVAGAAAKVRKALVQGLSGGFFNHLVTVGGPDTESVEKVLRRAVRWLPECRRGNIHITIVTPASISDNTRQILREKRFKLQEIRHAFTDKPPKSGLR